MTFYDIYLYIYIIWCKIFMYIMIYTLYDIYVYTYLEW